MATKKYLSFDKLTKYDELIKGVITTGDADTLTAAKSYADGLGVNYDAAGAAATVQGKLDEEVTRAKAAEEANAAAAKKAQDEVDALELVVADKADASALAELDAYVGEIPEGATATNVVAYVQEKTAGIATDAALGELQSAVDAVEGKVADIEGDYLKKADKTELEGKITTAQGAADAAQSHSEGVAADLADAVEALETADAGQVERIAALEGTIVGLSGAMHFEGVIETDPTTITTGYEQGDVVIYGNKEYVWNNGAFVEFGDATVNAEAITALTGRVDGLAEDMTQAQTDIDNAEAAIALKADQSALDEAVGALEEADADQVERIVALEGKFGGADGSVEDMIADAKAEAIATAGTNADAKDAEILSQAKKYADDEDAKIESRVDALETASATHALASDLTTLAGRVTTAEGEIDTLQSEMDAVEAKAAANETAIATNTTEIAKKAAQADLEAAVARIAANETAIASFVEISEEEINSLFNA